MQPERVVALLDGDRRWAFRWGEKFRWDEKMVTKTGFVAAILDHQGPESYLLEFSFARTKTVGEATLVRIATGSNPDDGVASRVGSQRAVTVIRNRPRTSTTLQSEGIDHEDSSVA